MMTKEEFVSDPERCKAYQEWLLHPTTVQVLRFAQEAVNNSLGYQTSLVPGSQDSINTAALLYAEAHGRQETLNYITNLVAQVVSPDQQSLKATYGASEILDTRY